MKAISSGVLLRTGRWMAANLPIRFKKQGVGIMGLLLVNSILDLFGVASLIPLLSVVLQEDGLSKSKSLRWIYDLLPVQTEKEFIIWLCGIIGLVILLKTVANLLIRFTQARFAYQVYQFFAHFNQRYFLNKGLLFLKSQNSNQLVREINESASRLASLVVMSSLVFLNEIVVVLLIIVSILVYKPGALLLLAAIMLPGVLVFYRAVRKATQKIHNSIHVVKSDLLESLFQAIFGYADIQLNNSEPHFYEKYEKSTAKFAHYQTRLQVLNQAPARIVELIIVLGVLGIVIYGTTILQDREGLLLLMGVFGLAAFRIMPSINRMLGALLQIKGNQFVLDSLEERMQDGAEKDLESEEVLVQPIPFQKSFELTNVSYRYPQASKLVLNSINIQVTKGEKIGIIGRSGSGKTTLMNVMLGFLENFDGSFLIDGQSLGEHNIKGWRAIIGYVQQEVYLIDGTIAENIAFGASELNDSQLKDAIELSSLKTLIQELPDGINTRVGERGAQLSGGQRQRIAIARALYSGARILFFDEATSALDNETEREITEAMEHLAEHGLTMIVIAHRISTLKYCDRILELEAGQIKREVTFQELTATTDS